MQFFKLQVKLLYKVVFLFYLKVIGKNVDPLQVKEITVNTIGGDQYRWQALAVEALQERDLRTQFKLCKANLEEKIITYE